MNRQFLKGTAVLFVAVIVAYLPAIRAGWIWDDPQYVLQNPTLRSLDGLREMWLVPTSLPQWYPLVHTTFWIEYHVVGTQPLLYHIDNVLLHAACAILIWRILRRLEVPGAFFAACVFALHPVMVESVAWVTERKNVLSLLFYLLAMQVYLFRFALVTGASPKRDWRAYALAFVFFLAALFSKTVTASLPAAILVILWWKWGRLRFRDCLPLLPFFIVGALLAWNTGRLEQSHVGASASITSELNFNCAPQRCLIAGRAIWFYLGKLLWPHPLVFIYPRWRLDAPVAWVFPVMVVVVTVSLFALRRRIGRGPLAAWLLYCGTLFPALGFVNVYPMRYSFVADHFQYHASVAIIALVVALVTCGVRKMPPRMRGATWLVVLIGLGCLTWKQSRNYTDAETLWAATAVRNPGSWMVQVNLGDALTERRRNDLALAAYSRALELAPNLSDAHYSKAVGLANVGRIDEALIEFQVAADLEPRNPRPLLALGDIKLFRKEPDRAIEYYQQAIKAAPDAPAAHFKLANLLVDRRAFDEAIEHFRKAVAAQPNWAEAWTNLGNAYYQTQRFPEAADAFAEALRIEPNLEPARRGLQAARRH